jgi:predicted permease
MLTMVGQDVTFALRKFQRSPGFAVTVVVTLALGIGATTAIFSLVDGILLRPLPLPRADRLVAIDTLQFAPGVDPANLAAGNAIETSYPDFFDWKRQNHAFASLASYDPNARLFSKANGEDAQVIACGWVSANLFDTLGVAPALGRTFRAEEEQAGHHVVILSHELWVSAFGSSPEVIGQTVRVSDWPSTVVGVMPAGFHYPIGDPAKFWATFSRDNEGPDPQTSFRDKDRLQIIGRLKDGVATPQALADLNAIQRGLSQQYSEDRSRGAVTVQPLLDRAVEDFRPVLSLLLAAVGVVLLIGCANVAGLLLARSAARRPEVALRTALGASRVRVVRQLLVEALLLALSGGALGVCASIVLLRAGLRLVPHDVPRLYNISIDGRVLAFAVALSAATALIFGLLPAWRMSRIDPANALREFGATVTSGRRRNRAQYALVVAETALSFSLLMASSLLVKSLLNVLHLDPGFDTEHTVSFDIALTNRRYPDPSKVAYFRKLLPEIGAIPGVEKVGSGHPLPTRSSSWANFTITGQTNSADNLPGGQDAAVTPGFFETLSIPLFRGRTFTEHDNDPQAAPVAIINRSLERQYFGGADPIGHFITPVFPHSGEPVTPRQIVGVVGDTRSELWDPYQPEFYLPYAQEPTHQRTIVVMKVAGDPVAYANTVANIVARFDKDAPMFGYQTFSQSVGAQAAQPRFEAVLVSGFAGIALFLSAVGLYGVLSYIVGERVREMGLRMALGASRGDVLRMVMRKAAWLAGLGIAAGILVSLFATVLVRDVLFRVEPLDRSVFFIVTLVLMLVSVGAALAPALRAANVDPMRTLREQ